MDEIDRPRPRLAAAFAARHRKSQLIGIGQRHFWIPGIHVRVSEYDGSAYAGHCG
jgi:hypothetical protein